MVTLLKYESRCSTDIGTFNQQQENLMKGYLSTEGMFENTSEKRSFLQTSNETLSPASNLKLSLSS